MTGRHHRPPRYRLRRPQWPSWLLNWAWSRHATPYYAHTVVYVEPHARPPRTRARAVPDPFGVPAAVLPDVNVAGLEHLRKPGYEFPTDTWAAYVDGMEP